jgi:nickel-type superoxide dismutase maturation protease
MLPSLKSGDTVIVAPSSKVKLGDIGAAAHPFKQSVTVIKRVESIDSNSRFVLIGDNPEASTDSRTFGSVPAEDIFGKVIARQFPQ